MRKTTCLGLLAALLMSGCSRSPMTPGEAFAALITKPVPPDVTRLKASVVPGKNSPAWFRFDASVQALEQVQRALHLAEERNISSKSGVRFQLYEDTFRNAPQEVRPPRELLGEWTMYRGETDTHKQATMLVKTDPRTGYSGDVFLCLK